MPDLGALEQGARQQVWVGGGQCVEFASGRVRVGECHGRAQVVRFAREAQVDPGAQVRVRRVGQGRLRPTNHGGWTARPAGSLGEDQPRRASGVSCRHPRDRFLEQPPPALDFARFGEPLPGAGQTCGPFAWRIVGRQAGGRFCPAGRDRGRASVPRGYGRRVDGRCAGCCLAVGRERDVSATVFDRRRVIREAGMQPASADRGHGSQRGLGHEWVRKPESAARL